MKIEKEVVEKTYYVCEVCNEKNWTLDEALKCEQNHLCKHEEIVYKLEHAYEYSVYISKYCKNKKCKKELGTIDFYHNSDETLLSYIYQYLDKRDNKN